LAGSAGVSGTNDGTNFSAQFNRPIGLTVDTHSNIFVADAYNSTIRRVSPSGTNWVVTTIAGLAGHSGNVNGTNNGARLSQPDGIARDAAGNLYVADQYVPAIRKITPMGTNWVVTTIAGGIGGNGDGTNGDAQFSSPWGITTDSQGILYVADNFVNTIRKLTPMGTNWVVTTIGGFAGVNQFADGTNSQARFFTPSGITADPRGNLFVADEGNNIIRLGQSLAGTLQIFPAPNRQALLYWPSWSTNALQTTWALTNSAWTNVSGTVQQGASFVSTNSTTNAAAFFRLH
jgi:sugar lactone lactonase YvrE